MPGILERFKPGDSVNICCPQQDCAGITITVTLGNVHPVECNTAFAETGRLHWERATHYKVFVLRPQAQCPKCNTVFDRVIVVDTGTGLLFGFSSETT